jgi:branched-chain amino acid transport system substrate-binding protein
MPKGGINGVKITFEECETGYATDKGVECYERLKGKTATLFEPLSTGITFALTDKAPGDKIPLITAGYGRASPGRWRVQVELPAPGHLLDGPTSLIQHIGKKEGGLDKLKGKKIALVYHDSPYGKEPIPLLQERAKMHGFDLQLLPVTAPGVEQKSTWLQVRQSKPDYVLLWGWGVMNSTALKEAVRPPATRARRCTACGGPVPSPTSRTWAWAPRATTRWPCSTAPTGSKIVAGHPEVRARQGPGHRPEGRSRPGAVHARRDHPDAGVEGVRRAQERFGKGKVMTGEQVRWGLENLSLDQKKLDALGFAGVMRPVSTSCQDHMGSTWARVHTWDGAKWPSAPTGTRPTSRSSSR